MPYDPQRSRPRPPVSEVEPAPVDALLDASHDAATEGSLAAAAGGPAGVEAPEAAVPGAPAPVGEAGAAGGVRGRRLPMAAGLAGLVVAALLVLWIGRRRGRRRAGRR